MKRCWASVWFFHCSFFVTIAFWGPASASGAQNALVDTGAVWRFLDNGSNQRFDWIDPWFYDDLWNSGPSPIGYGEPYIVTQTQPNIITTYFRHTFNVQNALAVTNLTIYVLRDDGVRVFLNGWEIFRDNLPANANYQTRADVATEAFGYLEWEVDPFLLMDGPNVLAVEVHQAAIPSSDLVLDLKLVTDSDVPVQNERVTITGPVSGTVVRRGSNVSIAAEVSGTTNPVSRVEFFANTTSVGLDSVAPYEAIWSNVPIGDFVLRAVATAGGIVFTSAPVALTVVSNLAPTGNIINPPNGASLPEGDILVEAVGSDPDGSVAKVEFFANNVKVGEDTLAPFSLTWSNASAGTYSLTARFTDNEGGTGDSPSISIQVMRPLGLIRGPYLQMATKTSIIVRWRTDVGFDSQVRYGTSAGQLNNVVTIPGVRTEHDVPLTGLSPGSKYYYSIGYTGHTLASGPDYFFVTQPISPQPTRIWVIGDSGTATAGARAVFDQYRLLTGPRYTDVWLMLGDNAYGSGTDAEYQAAVFDMYPELLRQTAVWPTIGNHDASPEYLDIFNLPSQAEAGGVSSGSENYYSFNYGNIHFVNLGGYYSGSRLSNGVMYSWLQEDLAANTSEWLIAYWHQPPYTHGSHNSDYEGDLIEMRENFVPLLEAYGVDLVLCGHSHCYERSFLMRGHYGKSWDLDTNTMVLDGRSGREDELGPYVKRLDGPTANHGTVYAVTGCSGWATFGSMDHPAMFSSILQMGSLVLDIDGDTLRGRFLRETGTIDDYFTIHKAGSGGPYITWFRLEEGTFNIGWRSVPGTKYRLQYATDLGTQNWQSIGAVITPDTNEASTSHVTSPTERTAFYRIAVVE
jgi:hypothetical protein